MSYVEEFKLLLESRDMLRFLQLWEEYCNNDIADGKEFREILTLLKNSDLAISMGKYIETALPLWSLISDPTESHAVLRLILDLQTTQSELLADTAYKFLKEKYGEQRYFNDKIRLVGLRNRKNFQGAIRNYELLTHIDPGKFVYHTGGWGTGEIINLSLTREELSIEFENIGGRKDVSFINAFNTLIALPDTHFLSRRFSNPDALEKEAKEDPLAIIHMLLRDLGPKTAGEIKDEMCGLVIPEEEWGKWWQAARAKIKKDTFIESPSSLREPFKLRSESLSHEERFITDIKDKTVFDDLLQTSYSLVRDFPDVIKKEAVAALLKDKFSCFLPATLSIPQQFQRAIFLEMIGSASSEDQKLRDLILTTDKLAEHIDAIDILAFKKRALVEVQRHRKDWIEIFLDCFTRFNQAPLRDYLLKELNSKESASKLKIELQTMLAAPTNNPDLVVWYFQKAQSQNDIPFGDKQGLMRLFEAFLTLYSQIEMVSSYRDLVKKMYGMISSKRYAMVRELLASANLEDTKEYLLLVSKCQTLTDSDKKILRSLAEVVHPSLSTSKKKRHNEHALWTTEEGYRKTQERIRLISTVEIVENAREIEAARALGDLRENAEYKSALEKRSRLQAELKQLSDQFNHARIIAPDDISTDEVGIGNIVEVVDNGGKQTVYTILGPWDTDPEKGILSFQSKFVQAMQGCRPGESFHFKDDDYKVVRIKSFLDKK